MKTEMLYDRLSDKWVPAPVKDLFIDKPLDGLLENSLFSSLGSNMQESADGYTLEVAVPGLKKKHLKVEVADGLLTVQGQKQQKKTAGWTGKVAEHRSTRIYKTFTLPEDADVNGIKAKCRDGLLNISIPKVIRQSSFRTIAIEPVEDSKQMNWWRKLVSLLERLEMKMSHKMRRLGLGFKEKKSSLS